MNRHNGQKVPRKSEKKQISPVGSDGDAIALGRDNLSTFDGIGEELDELLSRSKAKGYELAKKYRQKSGE